ncbi:hypothetical protein [Celeribacter baekdonensis]|uniref:hypothetical protein n=1 Tax=Celeribacter baekdonensis TaxID=875171 RepID=UPI0030DD5EF9|tara:strand:+ start:12462 stop:12920 length:459 start_codon:yes stop_codon:yes gene_type:complete
MNERENLWDYFEQREEELIRLREELKNELDQLRQARTAIEDKQKASEQNKEKLTIKDMIRSVLSDNLEGGTSDQIIHWINIKHNADIARTSLSPQLSRLKADQEIDLDDDSGIWRFSSRPPDWVTVNEHGRTRTYLTKDGPKVMRVKQRRFE